MCITNNKELHLKTPGYFFRITCFIVNLFLYLHLKNIETFLAFTSFLLLICVEDFLKDNAALEAKATHRRLRPRKKLSSNMVGMHDL